MSELQMETNHTKTVQRVFSETEIRDILSSVVATQGGLPTPGAGTGCMSRVIFSYTIGLRAEVTVEHDLTFVSVLAVPAAPVVHAAPVAPTPEPAGTATSVGSAAAATTLVEV